MTAPEQPPERFGCSWLLARGVLLLLVIGFVTLCFAYGTYAFNRVRSAQAKVGTAAVLDAQVSAWNTGDLDGFMAGYWNSEGLKFLSGDTVTTGWQATHDRYVKRYKSDGKEMGQLAFTDLDFEALNGDAAVVRGRWALTLKDGSNPHGLFTLLFRRIDGEWKIVSDHTSAADPPKKDEKK